MAAQEPKRPIRFAEVGPAHDTMRDFSTGAKRFVEKQLAQRLLAGGTTGGSAVKSPVSELVLGDIRIVNGTVRYTDERDGSNAQVGAINASFDLASLS